MPSPYRAGVDFPFFIGREWIAGDLAIEIRDPNQAPLIGPGFVIQIQAGLDPRALQTVPEANVGTGPLAGSPFYRQLAGLGRESLFTPVGYQLVLLGVGLGRHGGTIQLMGYESRQLVVQGICAYRPMAFRSVGGTRLAQIRIAAQQNYNTDSRALSHGISDTDVSGSVSAGIGRAGASTGISVSAPTHSVTRGTTISTSTRTGVGGLDMRQIM